MGSGPNRVGDMPSIEWWIGPGRLWNIPNSITATRLVVAIALGAYGIASHSLTIIVLAYAVYWVGDMADGVAARLLRSQTRLGAMFDIVSDRASTGLLACGLLLFRPDGWVAIAVFLLQFMVLDTLLSSSFLRWGLLSPNDFADVDPDVYRWNWSPAAKASNTAAVAVLVVLNLPWLAAAVAMAVLVVKVKSVQRVGRLMAEVRPVRTSA